MDTEHSVTTDCFQEAKFHWLLCGNESWKATVASVPKADITNVGYGLAALGSLSCQWSFGFEGRTSILADRVNVRHLVTHIRCANFVSTVIAHYLRHKIVATCRMG